MHLFYATHTHVLRTSLLQWPSVFQTREAKLREGVLSILELVPNPSALRCSNQTYIISE